MIHSLLIATCSWLLIQHSTHSLFAWFFNFISLISTFGFRHQKLKLLILKVWIYEIAEMEKARNEINSRTAVNWINECIPAMQEKKSEIRNQLDLWDWAELTAWMNDMAQRLMKWMAGLISCLFLIHEIEAGLKTFIPLHFINSSSN